MASLPELAADSDPIKDILADPDTSHAEAVRKIYHLRGIQTSETAVRRYRRKLREPVATPEAETPSVVFDTDSREKLHDKLDELLDETNADPGSAKSMRVATWDSLTKNDAGEPEVTKLYGVRLESAKWAPSWPVVQPAAPVVITPTRGPLVKRGPEKLAVILPDPQIGFRFYPDTGQYDPFHDMAAMDVATQIIMDLCPTLTLCLGDFLDLAPFSRFEQEEAFAHTTQRAIDHGYAWLAQLSEFSDELVVMEGNHDRRLQNMVVKNAMAAFGLKKADDTDGWPVLSVPSLCRFDELGVEYVGGYPAGSYWINERLKCIHGHLVRSSGSTAKAVVDAERVSTIFGHIHRIETQYKTADVYGGGRVRLAHTPGCLCRIDGAVPSVKGSTDLTGRPVSHFEDWQQGLTVIEYTEGDAPFNLQSVFINTFEGHRTVFGDKTYLPRV